MKSSRKSSPRRAPRGARRRAPGPARRTSPGVRRQALVAYGRMVLETEARAIGGLRLGASFAAAVEWILACKGQVVLTGIGKPGFVAQKISATLASTGTHSIYLHPAEAAHGDLGRVSRADVFIALSNSGESEEILRLKKKMNELVAKHTGQSVERVERDADRDFFMPAPDAKAYGLVDDVVETLKAPKK